MALVDIGGLLPFPRYEYWQGGAGGPRTSDTTLDVDGEKWAFIFRCPKAGNISNIGIRFGGGASVDGATTLQVSLQDVDLTNGDSDGTADEKQTIVAGDITNNNTKNVTLDASRTVTLGQRLSVVVEYSNFVTNDTFKISTINFGAKQGPTEHSYTNEFITGSWVHSHRGANLEIGYDDGTYPEIIGCFPTTNTNATNLVDFNNADTPDEIGLRFKLTFPARLAGCTIGMDLDEAADIVLYFAAGSTTLISALDKDVRRGNVEATNQIPFTTKAILAKDTEYILALKPTTTTDIRLNKFDVRTAAVMDAWGGGQDFHYATAKNPTDSDDFTPTTTRRAMIGLLLDQLDNGVQVGGGTPFIIGG